MADTNDTIDGLLAEFRGYAAGMPPSYHVTMSWADFRRMLDRLEAAHKRERGDCAKLREALNRLVIASEGFLKTHSAKYYVDTTEALDKAKAALAAPARNCDKYSHDQALQVWASEKENERNGCFDEWLYEIAKEGGDK